MIDLQNSPLNEIHGDAYIIFKRSAACSCNLE